MTESIYQEIFKRHRSIIQYRNHPNPHQLVITFSATPWSGKTTLAKIIEKEQQAIRINNDDIRSIIDQVGVSKEKKQETLIKYLWRMWSELEKQQNQLLIFDSSIDRQYYHVLPLLQKKRLSLLVIRLEVKKNICQERINKREAEKSKNMGKDKENIEYLKQRNDTYQDRKKIGQEIAFKNTYQNNNEEEQQKIVQQINKYLSQYS